MFVTSHISLLISMAFTAVLEVLSMASRAMAIVELAFLGALWGVIPWSIALGGHRSFLGTLIHCCDRVRMGIDG
jgi:hypothetical protein